MVLRQKNTFNQIKKMKALHITLFALLISLGSVAQTDKESIQKWADIYMVYVQNNDIDKILDAMLPQLFETISRSQIKASMEQMLNNSNMKVEYLSAKINSISNTVKRDDTKYALVNYDSSFKMIFLTEAEKPLDKRKEMLDYFKTAMEAQFGKDSTTINYDEASVSVKSVTNMYAVSSPEFTGWKFLNDDNNMGTLAKTIIPEDVISALKN